MNVKSQAVGSLVGHLYYTYSEVPSIVKFPIQVCFDVMLTQNITAIQKPSRYLLPSINTTTGWWGDFLGRMGDITPGQVPLRLVALGPQNLFVSPDHDDQSLGIRQIERQPPNVRYASSIGPIVCENLLELNHDYGNVER